MTMTRRRLLHLAPLLALPAYAQKAPAVRARITGDPPTITTWVNGVQIMQHTEPFSQHPATGHIGLQIHGGAQFAGTVRYRNIRLRAL
jgi:hypothetical protein